MFSNAVLASAPRAVSRVHGMEPVGLDLAGPIRECPLAFNDDPGAACASLEALSVLGVEVPASRPPPPVGPTSPEQDRFRKEVHSALQLLLAPSKATGAVRKYEAALRTPAPMESEARFMPCSWPFCC